MDYRSYRLSLREKGKCLGMAVGLGAAIACLFYQSAWGLQQVPVLYLIGRHRAVCAGRERMQEELARQFLDALRSVSAALLAGFSMENAWREAQREIGALYGEDAALYRELEEMNQSVSLNIPLEQLLEGFATRSGNADIASFAEVFAFAKRSGGNFVTIIEGTSEHMRAKYETEREIQVLVASRRMEQKIMNVIPMLILAYLKVTSMDFLDILYGNAAGALFMTVCLLAYGGAILLAERILRIQM
jgi:tight adherence protein B